MPKGQFFSYIPSYISGRHVTPLGHIILMTGQPDFALTL